MKKLKKSTISDLTLGISLTLLTLFFFLLVWGPLESLERSFYDLRVSMNVRPTTAPIAVVVIDSLAFFCDHFLANISCQVLIIV